MSRDLVGFSVSWLCRSVVMRPVQSIINHELHFEFLSACMVMFIFASSAMQYVTCLSLVMTHVYYLFMKHPPSLCLPLVNIPSVSLKWDSVYCEEKAVSLDCVIFLKVFWNKVWYYVTYHRTSFLPQNSNCMWQNNQWQVCPSFFE